jgi:putative glutamine amidotransferase
MSNVKVGLAYPAFFYSFNKYIPQLEMVKNLEKVKDFDLMIFSGGEDVSPSFYGEYADGARGMNYTRDTWEKRVFERCRNDGVKMFGACRGHQLLNVLFGGSLVQDIFTKRGYFHPGEHEITYKVKDSGISKFFPKKVNSMHHQSIARMAPNIRSIATYKNDIEIAGSEDGNVLMVQFHPEFMGDSQKFFNYLVNDWAGKRKRTKEELEELKEAPKESEKITAIDVRRAALNMIGDRDFFDN